MLKLATFDARCTQVYSHYLRCNARCNMCVMCHVSRAACVTTHQHVSRSVTPCHMAQVPGHSRLILVPYIAFYIQIYILCQKGYIQVNQHQSATLCKSRSIRSRFLS